MKIDKFNESIKKYNIFYKKYCTSSDYDFNDIFIDIDILEDNKIKYILFYNDECYEFYLYVYNNKIDIYFNFNNSVYDNIEECTDDMTSHGNIIVNKDDAYIIINTKKFNL